MSNVHSQYVKTVCHQCKALYFELTESVLTERLVFVLDLVLDLDLDLDLDLVLDFAMVFGLELGL